MKIHTITAEMAADFLKAQSETGQVREFVTLRLQLAFANEQTEFYKLFARFGFNPDQYNLVPNSQGCFEFVDKRGNDEQQSE